MPIFIFEVRFHPPSRMSGSRNPTRRPSCSLRQRWTPAGRPILLVRGPTKLRKLPYSTAGFGKFFVATGSTMESVPLRIGASIFGKSINPPLSSLSRYHLANILVSVGVRSPAEIPEASLTSHRSGKSAESGFGGTTGRECPGSKRKWPVGQIPTGQSFLQIVAITNRLDCKRSRLPSPVFYRMRSRFRATTLYRIATAPD